VSGKILPEDGSSNDKVDDDEKYYEIESMINERRGRILWLGVRIAKQGKCLRHDAEAHNFSTAPEFEENIDFEKG